MYGEGDTGLFDGHGKKQLWHEAGPSYDRERNFDILLSFPQLRAQNTVGFTFSESALQRTAPRAFTWREIRLTAVKGRQQAVQKKNSRPLT
jgi:hypothetical protein